MGYDRFGLVCAPCPQGGLIMWKVLQLIEAIILIVILVPILIVIYPIHWTSGKVMK